MPQPTAYNPATDFSTYSTSNPNDPHSGTDIDSELAAIEITTDEIRTNMALLQRDDGKLANASVHIDAFDSAALALNGGDFDPQGDWVTATAYAVNDLVVEGDAVYLCIIAHTSGVFTTDKTAGNWFLFANPITNSGNVFYQSFNGDTSTTVFTLTAPQGTEEKTILVFVDSVPQIPVTDFTVNGTTLTFVSAPALGTSNIRVWAIAFDSTAAAISAAAAQTAQTAAEAAQTAAEAAEATATAAAGAVGGVTVEEFVGSALSGNDLTITASPADESQLVININGVTQRHSEYTVSGSVITFSTAPDAAAQIEVTTGAIGILGATGNAGPTGSAGLPGPIQLVFDDTDQVDEDKGTALVWLNDSDHTAAVTLYIDDNDTPGADISSWVQTWDDVSTSAIRGTITIAQNASPANYLMFDVTGAVTDATTYNKIAVTYVTGAGTIADTDAVTISFSRTGDAGSGLADIVDDTTPQLGGDLDLNGNSIDFPTTANISDVLDEDNMASDSPTMLATQQSIKAYADALTPIGQQTIWVPAGAMEAAVTTAAATSNAVEIATSLFAARTMDFAADADDFAYFGIQLPKSWDAGTLICEFVWSATGTTANTVIWGLDAVALGNDEVLTTAFGTRTTVTDTNSTTADDIMISPELTHTVLSTPAAENFVMFEVSRDVSDTLAEDARLHGIRIHYTVDTGVDD